MDHSYRWHQRENSPSFSSTLLDAMYRSIDESNGKGEEELIFYRESTRSIRKKHHTSTSNGEAKEERIGSLKKACMIEKWMQEKVISYEKVGVGQKSMAELKPRINTMLLNSSSSSSESSCGGGFSSSESEPIYVMQRPKPIRTSVSARPIDHLQEIKLASSATATQKPKHDQGSFFKTKSKALKIYGDLKKVKQPISPGGRLASFLNSLFTAGNAKKAKISSSKSEQTSTCSSASSFSRSCLSKTPSTRGNGTKRSVRFYPVSVIVDEDSRPCGHKSLYANNQEESGTLMAAELKFHVMNESRRVEQVKRDLLKNYQKKKQQEFSVKDLCNENGESSDEEDQELDDEDDDVASYASSDLFELDNLSAIGIERYRQELPVYETTHLDTNRAIANGLIL
ncbi:hypothetical protein JCGZ_24715 [Jatropha curcas]|uniref:Protein BIG GRAIN 1-like B n=1 Tax=Jatropha curcas TaxID=180498 RepID=A0A067KX25_JATCU|nr:protein BIG GRAIN 1-like B [Jatropha curcas]KDP40716.1 hypothetical protein JCGZ_24715 [Jatropha curcas]